MPRTPFSGVRISWLINRRNCCAVASSVLSVVPRRAIAVSMAD